MSIERIIGIDFGTSTSVIRVKRYQDGKPVGDGAITDTKEVIFENQPTVPTVIQRVGVNTYYGHDALVSRRKSVTYQGFKARLESSDAEEREEARELTAEFFQYLAKVYREQSNGGHLGDASDVEKTLISYPVKWSKETKAFMRETAAKAGFPNVEGMDEAEAAIHDVTIQYEHYLQESGFLVAGKPCTMLLIDMGAGTTDLVLCRYTPGEKAQNDILCTWPQKGEVMFGGQEVEEILARYIRSKLPEEDADIIMKRLNAGSFKSWKETVVSPALARNEKAEDFGALETIISIMDLDVGDYGISRASFEQSAAGYLRGFPKLVEDCVREAGISEEEVELVILTGGHSQWYFVKDILTGKYGKPDEYTRLLPRIQREPDRVITVTRPQEVVAQGLVYAPMNSETEPIMPMYGIEKNGISGTTMHSVNENKQEDSRIKVDGYKGRQQNPRYGNVISAYEKNRRMEIAAVTSNGNIITTDGSKIFEENDFVHVFCGTGNVFGVRSNGKVLATGQNDDKQCDVDNWSNIVTISSKYNKSIGVRADGTVVSAGLNMDGECNVREWKDVKDVACGKYFTVGLMKDGRVISAGTNKGGQGDVVKWNNIIDVMCSDGYIVGLKSDGTVEITVNEFTTRQFLNDVLKWKNIVSIACRGGHIVGLKKDGTVVAAGSNEFGECNVQEWHNIVSISCGYYCTYGVKKDGSIVSVGLAPHDIIGRWNYIDHIICRDNMSGIASSVNGMVIGIKRDGDIKACRYKMKDHGFFQKKMCLENKEEVNVSFALTTDE